VDYLREESAPEPIEWRRLTVRFSDTVSTNAKDDYFCSFDLVNVTNGNIDTTWSSTDYTTAEGFFDTMFTALKPYYRSTLTVDRYSWYLRRFNPYSETKPFADSGPPARVTTKTIAGTSTSYWPGQVAMSITEKTPWPKHWGRWYFPYCLNTGMTAGGRWGTTQIDAVAAAVNTCYNALGGAELFPVVPVTQVNKDPMRALIGVEKIQIDDIPDVVRRRRLADTQYRKILP